MMRDHIKLFCRSQIRPYLRPVCNSGQYKIGSPVLGIAVEFSQQKYRNTQESQSFSFVFLNVQCSSAVAHKGFETSHWFDQALDEVKVLGFHVQCSNLKSRDVELE
jgi:hypothetical protein